MNVLYYTIDLGNQEEGYKDVYLYLIKDNKPLLLVEIPIAIESDSVEELKLYLKFRTFEDNDSDDYSEENTELLKDYTEENTKFVLL